MVPLSIPGPCLLVLVERAFVALIVPTASGVTLPTFEEALVPSAGRRTDDVGQPRFGGTRAETNGLRSRRSAPCARTWHPQPRAAT